MLSRTSRIRRLVSSFIHINLYRAVQLSPEAFRLPAAIVVVPCRRMGNSGNRGNSDEKVLEKPVEPRVKYSEEQLREKLSTEEYNVTQNKGTERAFTGRYWDVKDDGTYTCIVCGEELFKSDTKFDSGSGWPSFSDVAAQGKVTKIVDKSLGTLRVEVVCTNCGAHLGHVFDDGPGPTNKRYCINSCSLRFNKEEK